MKGILLIFLSFFLLLFSIPKSSYSVLSGKKECAHEKSHGEKTCKRKCFKQEDDFNKPLPPASRSIDCSQQFLAVVNSKQAVPHNQIIKESDYVLPELHRYLSPILERDPEPPRFS